MIINGITIRASDRPALHCGLCGKAGHTKPTCPNVLDDALRQR